MEKGKVIVVTNRKGGSGKTTTTKNLAYNLTQLKYKVLIVDLDPQCNCTDGLSSRRYKKSVLNMLNLENIYKCIYHTKFENLDIIAGNDYLASAHIEDNAILNQIIKLKADYDYIIIDTSPYFNKLTAEVLKVHDWVIMPTTVEDDSLKGVLTTIEELTAIFGNNLHFRILYTMVDSTKDTRKKINELRTQLDPVSFKTEIRLNSIPVRRSRERRIPLSKRYKSAKVTKDYETLALEVKETI